MTDYTANPPLPLDYKTAGVDITKGNELVNDIKHLAKSTYDKTARIIPDGLCAHFQLQNYKLPDIFAFLQQQGSIATKEIWRTFNCGIGMVLITAKEHAKEVMDYYQDYSFNQYNQTTARIIGQISKSEQEKAQLHF